MKTKEIVQKLWKLCDVLRDDGITYQDYVTELTYLLFLKMAEETGAEEQILSSCRWEVLRSEKGMALLTKYQEILKELGEQGGIVGDIYQGASSKIDEPANLKKLIDDIDRLDWFSAKDEGLGDLYEGLLEKNANETKSGAGQYFTPRVLINVMTELTKPQPHEKCNDPACGTFGFMISAFQYVKEHTGDLGDLDEDTANFEVKEAFTGCELVAGTHRLALMNAMLHGIESRIQHGDTLSNDGMKMKGYDVVLTNPPFGTKKGGERASRTDLTFQTSNKQLNFLQHIYRSLNTGGKARAAVVLPDNVLFAEGDGTRIRTDLMDKCNLHTVLRLPTGIFYAKGVQTNVLFFTRGSTDKGNTKEVWFYDLRSDMRKIGVKSPLVKEDFAGFIKAYTAEDRHSIKDPRWTVYTREEIAKGNDSLDLGLKKAEKQNEVTVAELISQSEDCLNDFREVMGALEGLVAELKELESK